LNCSYYICIKQLVSTTLPVNHCFCNDSPLLDKSLQRSRQRCRYNNPQTDVSLQQSTDRRVATTIHRHTCRYNDPQTDVSLQQSTDRPVATTIHRQTCRYNNPQTYVSLQRSTDRRVATTIHRQTCRSTRRVYGV
jgi:hypothetical protein